MWPFNSGLTHALLFSCFSLLMAVISIWTPQQELNGMDTEEHERKSLLAIISLSHNRKSLMQRPLQLLKGWGLPSIVLRLPTHRICTFFWIIRKWHNSCKAFSKTPVNTLFWPFRKLQMTGLISPPDAQQSHLSRCMFIGSLATLTLQRMSKLMSKQREELCLSHQPIPFQQVMPGSADF